MGQMELYKSLNGKRRIGQTYLT